ncbi:ferritin-like domain-containing protein [Pseudonocardia sp. TRM90224]|uniref:ferritin-like domain-containing protein n=1 Tax=Pseudonocardia sp. TRM90224 TaxID=2812678 RepID=UPI001E447302|nr:ferritin-like domain-containing protein [Pseudonocardia sp. TRM90224]
MTWQQEFEAAAAARPADPDWTRGAHLQSALAASLQRFQVGEAGDGANLIGKADRAGDPGYAAAVRLFVAEEQNHARMLGLLLDAGGVPLIGSHWSDAVFVALRRSLGLRTELMVLMVAEVIALRYYRALRDGAPDPLVREVSGRILADEERHVPFHVDRLRAGFATLPVPARVVVVAGWWVLFCGAAVVVAWDHGPALVATGVRRRGFLRDVVGLVRRVVADVFAVRAPAGAR